MDNGSEQTPSISVEVPSHTFAQSMAPVAQQASSPFALIAPGPPHTSLQSNTKINPAYRSLCRPHHL